MHHVGIYVGNGMVVHAANPSSGVQYIPMHEMPISGMVRP
jgi:cell wall-associated NlpC family hydrolase